MIIRFLLAAAATIAVPVALLGAEPGPPGSKAERSARKICKTSGVIGSRLGAVRRCRTKAEWEQAQRETRQAIDRYQHLKASVCNNGRAMAPSQGGASTLGGTCG